MKHLFFTVGLAACLFSFSAFASGPTPNALNSFNKTFKNAENVNWTEVGDMTRIGFTLNGHQQFAYYSNDQLIVLATEIKLEELPVELKGGLSEYKASTISQLYELVLDGDKEYYAVINSDSKLITLKGKNTWKVFLEEKK